MQDDGEERWVVGIIVVSLQLGNIDENYDNNEAIVLVMILLLRN
jgi:hypothetical protein